MRSIISRILIVVSMMLLGAACVQGAAPVTQPPLTPDPERAAAGPGAADWQKKWADTLSAAKKEGVVVVYGEITPGMREALTAGFESKYGIQLEFVIARSVELAVKWDREHLAGVNQVDVFNIGTGTSIQSMKPKGAFQPVAPYLILPEVLDPKAWPEGKIRFLDKDGTVIPLNSAWTSAVGVNTDMVKEGQLTSYKDLLKPEWKGKVALFDPSRPGASASWATYMVMHAFGREGGKEYLRQFAATGPAATKDVRQLVEWVAKGKYGIGVGVQHALTVEFKQMGAPITINRFVEGGTIQPGSGCVQLAARPPHPNAAIVYMNWLLTPEGQIAFNKPTGNPPVRLDVKIEGLDPLKMVRPGDKAFLVDEDFIALQDEVQKLSGEIFGHLFQ